MKTPKVSVIIPNWNGEAILKDCLYSLDKQVFKDFEIIIVDNNSTDNSLDFIKKNFSEIRIIKLDKNYGFAFAINEGVKASASKYVAFLNNDTAVDRDWLKELVEFYDKHSKLGSVGSKLVNFFDHSKIDGVGIEINEVGQAKSIGWEQDDKGQFNHEMNIFGATAGAAIFNREVFIKVGMFDKKYFMYSEEVDWAFRAQFLGYKSMYCPKAIVYHKHKVSSRKKPQHLEYWQFRNMTMTIIKDFPNEILYKNFRLFKIIMVHINTYIYQVKSGYLWAPFLSDLYIIYKLPELLKQRARIQSKRYVENDYIESFIIPKKITFFGLLKKGI